MSYTGISSSRSSTHYDERCFLRSMSTTPSARVPSRSCCAPARPQGVEVRAICAGSCAISANVGPGRASPSGATATMAPRRWNGARPSASITSSGSGSKPLAKKIDEAVDAVRTERALSNKPVVAATPKRATRPNPGAASDARRPHRSHSARARHRFVVTNVEYGRRNGFTPPSIARAGRPRTSSSCTGAARFRSNVLSFRDRKSGPPRAAHGGLLAHAHRSRRHPETARSSQRRVLDLATAADQDRRPRHRNGKPRPSRFRRRLPGGRPLPRPARSPRPARTLNGGARSPSAPRHPSNAFAKVSVVRR